MYLGGITLKKMISIGLSFFVVYLLLDYINIFQLLGLSFGRININVLDVLINSIVVIVLYIVTYMTLNKKQIQKEKNSKEMADVLLLNAYMKCNESLSFVCDREFVERYIVPKADFNKIIQEDEMIKNICNSPFYTNDSILRLAESGYVEKEVLEKYLLIQKDFKHWVSNKITFYDLDGTGTAVQQKFYNNMQLNLGNLRKMLEKEIKRLSK